MANPQIVYNSVPLSFTYPPVNKPGAAFMRDPQREDTVSTEGDVQSVWWRTDEFFTLDMQIVPNDDLPLWEAFIEWAEQGKQFTYFPDAEVPDSTVFILERQAWNPVLAFKGHSKFTLKFRKVVADDIGS